VWFNNEGLVGVKFVFLREPAETVLQNWCRRRQPSASADRLSPRFSTGARTSLLPAESARSQS
jgi:hypothetical protein